MPDYSFGEILKQYREQHGNMSQQELADILGTTKQVISRYETGQRDPKISVAVSYAEKLGIPLSELLGDSVPLSEQVPKFDPDKLIELRNERGLSLADAADVCNISIEDFARIESGRIAPTVDHLKKIAFCLHTSMDALCSLSWELVFQNPSGIGFQRLTETEYAILMLYRAQSPAGKEKMYSDLKERATL